MMSHAMCTLLVSDLYLFQIPVSRSSGDIMVLWLVNAVLPPRSRLRCRR
jgi:hypothetical protein